MWFKLLAHSQHLQNVAFPYVSTLYRTNLTHHAPSKVTGPAPNPPDYKQEPFATRSGKTWKNLYYKGWTHPASVGRRLRLSCKAPASDWFVSQGFAGPQTVAPATVAPNPICLWWQKSCSIPQLSNAHCKWDGKTVLAMPSQCSSWTCHGAAAVPPEPP